MRSALTVEICCALLLAGACAPSTPIISRPVTAATDFEAPTQIPTELPLPFTPATYRDEVNGFELDYPSEWSIEPNTQIGSRGSQAQFLSPGTTAEMLPEGGSRLSIVVYEWDPKGDLAAYVTHRRSAWAASGFKVLDGPARQLADGRPASDFFIEAPDGALAYFLLTTSGDQYLQLAGEGDLQLLETMANTLRPLGHQPQ